MKKKYSEPVYAVVAFVKDVLCNGSNETPEIPII